MIQPRVDRPDGMETAFADYLDDFTRRDWEHLDPKAVTDPVRVAIVGLGWFAAREWALPGIARSAFTDATVVTDVDADAVEAVAAEHDVTDRRDAGGIPRGRRRR